MRQGGRYIPPRPPVEAYRASPVPPGGGNDGWRQGRAYAGGGTEPQALALDHYGFEFAGGPGVLMDASFGATRGQPKPASVGSFLSAPVLCGA
jgi:hypothetical protein